MKVLHVHDDGTIDAVSHLTPDPTWVDERMQSQSTEIDETTTLGLAMRWMAVQNQHCECGADLLVLNRAVRRKMHIAYNAQITHFSRCPAMAESTRRWLFQNRRAIR